MKAVATRLLVNTSDLISKRLAHCRVCQTETTSGCPAGWGGIDRANCASDALDGDPPTSAELTRAT